MGRAGPRRVLAAEAPPPCAACCGATRSLPSPGASPSPLPPPFPHRAGSTLTFCAAWRSTTGSWRRRRRPPRASASLPTALPPLVTGQQAGLLGGPFLTVIKALTAVRVAKDLTRSTGRDHVPVFWAESDDHDVDEANEAVTLDRRRRGSLFQPALARSAPGVTHRIPAPRERGGGVWSPGFSRLPGKRSSPVGLAERLRADLAGSPDFGRWFARGMLSLLGGKGLVVFDALEERYKEFARNLWVRVLEDPLHLTAELEAAGERVTEAGYAPILAKKRRRCPFFLITGGRRETVFFERGVFSRGERPSTPTWS